MFRNLSTMLLVIGLFLQCAYAVDIRVQNAPPVIIGSNAVDLNGKYLPVAPQYGYPAWKHESLDFFIYYHEYSGGGVSYWNIDNDFNDNASFYFSNDNATASSPALASSWKDGNTGEQVLGMTVAEVAVVPVPEILLNGNGVGISDGNTTISFTDHTHFGSADIASGAVSRTYTIYNTGTADLGIQSLGISGDHYGDFSITSFPASPIPAGTYANLTVLFNPSAVGNRNATISINNSDADESPFTFNIQGYGYTPGNIQVSGITQPNVANGVYVHQGVRNGYEYWKHETEEYYVEAAWANGMNHWLISNKLNGTYSDCMWSRTSSAVNPIALTGWGSSNATAYTGTPVIAAVAAVPDMVISGANTSLILDNDVTPRIWDGTHFGAVSDASGNRSRTFTIQNVGGAALNITDFPERVVIAGDAAADFTVTSQPLTTLDVNASTTFTLQFDPSIAGTRSATISIYSNDPNESPYNFSIVGEGVGTRSLYVSGISSPTQANGRYVHQGVTNEFQYWKHESQNYYIYNAEYSLNRYWFMDTDQNSSTFLLRSTSANENAVPVGVAAWQNSGGSGTTATIQFAEAEIAVAGNTLSITDGDLTPSVNDHTHFGDLNITDAMVTRTYTISNSGTDILNLTGNPRVSVQGSGDFVVLSQPAATVTPNTTTTFSIQFNPSTLGSQSAAVTITNSDTDESIFNFNIEGTAFHTSPSVSTISAMEIGKYQAKIAGSVTSVGSYPVTQRGFCWNTTGFPTLLDQCSQLGSNGTPGVFDAVISGLAPGTNYYVVSYATSDAGTGYGSPVSFQTIALSLQASVATIDFSIDASTANESVTANVDWIAQSNATWLTVEPSVGSGNGPLVIRATKNLTVATRSGMITLSSMGVADQTIQVSQAAGDPTLALDKADLSFSKLSENQNVTVTSNAPWSASANQSWVSLTPTAQSGSGVLKISVSANSTILSRQAIVTVKVAGLSDQEIAITQAAGDPTLALSKSSINFANGVGQNSFDISSNANWTITSSATWVTLNSASGSGNESITVNVTANSTYVTRSATITVRCSGLADKTVSIQQAAANPPPNRAPVLASVKTGLSTDEDKAFTLSRNHVVATDEDDDDLSLIVAAGSHYSVKGLVVTPEKNFFGKLSISVSVNDGALSSNSKTLTLEVNSVNDRPTVRDTLVKSTAAFTLDLSKLASDVEGSIASVQLVRTAKKGTTVLTGTTIKFTPNKGFVGKDTLTWIAIDEDNGKSDTALLAIQINAATPILDFATGNIVPLRILGQSNSELIVQWSIPQGVYGELSLESIDGSRIVIVNELGTGDLQQRSIQKPSQKVGVQYLVLRVDSHVRSRIPFTWR